MKYLVAIHHPENYNPAVVEDDAMHHDIDVLNEEMQAAGARIFVGGLQSTARSKSLRPQSDKQVLITDGPYLETREHIGGFWVLEVASEGEAIEWGKRAALACRVPVEIRPFH